MTMRHLYDPRTFEYLQDFSMTMTHRQAPGWGQSGVNIRAQGVGPCGVGFSEMGLDDHKSGLG